MIDNMTLSPRQRRAVEALTQTGNASAAAQSVGCSRETLYRWLKAPAFRDALEQAQAAALEQLQADLLRLASEAAGALKSALTDQGAPLALRIRAADIVLSHFLRIRELAELERRLAALEQQAR